MYETDHLSIVIFGYVLKGITASAIVLGLVGSLLQYLIYSRRNLVKLSFSLYFRVRAIVDAFITLHLIRFFVKIQFNYIVTNQTDALCKVIHYTIYSAGPISEWIMIAISFDRLIAIVFPRRFMFLFRRRVQIIILLLIFTFNMIYFGFMLWNMHLEEENNSTQTSPEAITTTTTTTESINQKHSEQRTRRGEILDESESRIISTNQGGGRRPSSTNETATSTYVCNSSDFRLLYWLDLFAAAIVPFSLMVVIDSILILFIFKSRKRIRSTAYKTSDMRRISSKDRKFSITSISLNFIILLCNAPTTIFSIIHHENDPETPSIRLFEDYLRFFFYAHYALGFFVQLAINSIIRKEFLKMLNLVGMVKKPSEVRSGHQSELKTTTPTTPTPTVAVIS